MSKERNVICDEPPFFYERDTPGKTKKQIPKEKSLVCEKLKTPHDGTKLCTDESLPDSF